MLIASSFSLSIGALPNEPNTTDLLPVTSCPAMMHKGSQAYLATTVSGHPVTLRGPSSDVKVDIPGGIHGILVGHVELNPGLFLQYIPQNECIITAIPDFKFTATKEIEHTLKRPKFQIRLKHTIDNVEDLKYIRVRHGDIHKDIDFDLIPHNDNNPEGNEIYWEADINFITITTNGFSQFLCTSCKKLCDTRLAAFVSGAMKDLGSCIVAETVLIISPLQFTTKDYKLVSLSFLAMKLKI